MNNKVIGWVIVAVVVIGGIWYWQSEKTSNVSSNQSPIKIGAVLGLTGMAAVDSLNIQRGIELARNDLAAQKINVEIAYEDDGTDAAKTVSAVQKLLLTDKPQALMGFTWDFNLAAVMPILDSNKIIGYAPSNTIDTFTLKSPYVFYGSVTNEKKVDAITSYLRDHNIKKVGIIASQTSWGENHIDIFTRATLKAGGSVVLVEKLQYGLESSVIPTTVAKLKSYKAEAVLITHSETAASVLLKRLQESNFDIPVLGTVDVKNAVDRGLVKKTAKADWLAFVNPTNEDFRKKFVDKYKEEPGNYARNAYDGLMVLVEAIRNTNGTSDEIADYMKGGKVKYQGYVSDSFNFDQNGALKGGVWELTQVK